MNNYEWPVTFQEIYNRAVATYRNSPCRAATLFNDNEKNFLATLGCGPQELFDFVEDFVRDGEPAFNSVLLMTAARRDYFLIEQGGKPASYLVEMSRLPAKTAELAGVAWLPRIIEKAKAKLRGEMPAELMYGCSGDRRFLKSVNVELAEFLRMIWAAGEDQQKVVDFVLRRRSQMHGA